MTHRTRQAIAVLHVLPAGQNKKPGAKYAHCGFNVIKLRLTARVLAGGLPRGRGRQAKGRAYLNDIDCGLRAALDASDLKAVSMNLMHASLGVTDSIYAVLADRDLQERIARLGQGTPDKPRDVEALLREVLERLTRGK